MCSIIQNMSWINKARVHGRILAYKTSSSHSNQYLCKDSNEQLCHGSDKKSFQSTVWWTCAFMIALIGKSAPETPPMTRNIKQPCWTINQVRSSCWGKWLDTRNQASSECHSIINWKSCIIRICVPTLIKGTNPLDRCQTIEYHRARIYKLYQRNIILMIGYNTILPGQVSIEGN